MELKLNSQRVFLIPGVSLSSLSLSSLSVCLVWFGFNIGLASEVGYTIRRLGGYIIWDGSEDTN